MNHVPRNTRYASRFTKFSSTSVENPLYLSRVLYKSTLFMQNKPNFQKSQMNANLYNTTNYERKRDWTLGENKPNSNPNKPNLKRAKMNINSIITKDYRKKEDFLVRIYKPNSKPISEKPKMSVNLYIIEDYENETAFGPQKNKPNQSQFQTGHQPPHTFYLPPIFFKKIPKKNAPNLQETFNMHLFFIR